MPWHMRKMKTLTEKRFFEWHEDDTSVTLRNVSASYGGGSEVLVIVLAQSAPSATMTTKDQTGNTSVTES